MPFIRKCAWAHLAQMLWSTADPLSSDPREAVLKSVWESSRPSRVYWLMNALATVIACYGLFAGSAAVVIGAMVVAILLGPIPASRLD